MDRNSDRRPQRTWREWLVMGVALFTAGVVGAVFARVTLPAPTAAAMSANNPGVYSPAPSAPASRSVPAYNPAAPAPSASAPGYSPAPDPASSTPAGPGQYSQGGNSYSSTQPSQGGGGGRWSRGGGGGRWSRGGRNSRGGGSGGGPGGGGPGGQYSPGPSAPPSSAAPYAPGPQSSAQAPPPSSSGPPVASGACGVQPSWAPSGCQKIALDNEFNGTSLPSTWTTGWFGTGITGPVNGMECAKYSSSNVSVSGGYLHLAMQGGYGAIVSSNPNAGGGFQFTDGTVEWRAYLPPLNGNPSEIANWPALWLDGQKWPGDGEFDVVEGLHGNAMWHIPTDGNAGGQDGGGPGWHTFGVSWTSGGTVTFYHDSQQVGTVNGVPNNQPMYLIMGNQCGSSTQQSGTDMLVDWVRVWS